MLLENKVAIITGGGNGIGKAIAIKFAEEGAIVVPADIDMEKSCAVADEISKMGREAMPFKTDVADAASVSGLIKEVINRFEQIDILVNNAGIMFSTSIEETTEKEWDRVFAVNIKGTFLCCQTVLPYMKKRNFGRIINMSSSAGKDGGVSAGLAYASSKAAVIGFTRALAKRIAPYGITCNSIAPGTTKSDMIAAFSEEEMKKIIDTIPLKRLGEPNEIADLACLIASKSGSFMTGAVFDINGGIFIG